MTRTLNEKTDPRLSEIVPLFAESNLHDEKLIVGTIIQDALEAGYSISVYNGLEDDEGVLSPVELSTSLPAICAALFDSDEASIELHDGEGFIGSIELVHGNRPWEVVSDYTLGPKMSVAMQRSKVVAQQIRDTILEDEDEAELSRMDAADRDAVEYEDDGDSYQRGREEAAAGHRGEY